ncbi:MAG: hypothetical protein ACTSRN_04110, partial [Alphaproteobacteria bacterium]
MVHDSLMWFGNFLFRSLKLSLIVTLYWLPVLVVVNYAAYAIFLFFQSEPLALGMIVILLIQPYFVIQGILAVRGGMMVLGVTNGADLAMLGTVTFRVMRFNLTMMWIVIMLFGLASTITGLRILGSDFIDQFMQAKQISSIWDITAFFHLIGEFPLFLLGGWIFGFCVAIGLMGVSTAGAAAMAASRPPNHHSIWGIAAEFLNLFLLALVIMFLPFVVFVFALNGFDTTLGDLVNLTPVIQYSTAGYVLWTVCALSAGIALAYSITLKTDAEKHEAMLAAAGGMTRETVDLKSLRESR